MRSIREKKMLTAQPPRRGRTRRRAIASAVMAVALTITGLTVGATPANAVVVGACTIKANNPHASGHVSGAINAEGSLRCTIGMTEIYIRAYLEKSGGSSWGGNTQSWLNTPAGMTYSSFANTSCSQAPGTFRTRVSYTFTSPPGVNPSYTANTIYSPWIGLACGVSRVAPQSADSADAKWTSEKALPDGVTLKDAPGGAELIFTFQN
ncbi:hypothetical protein HQQ81_21110 [Microbacteriaceae bacterium VKM Ac-2854]|nr:hypothetical protein [Microbacteriaceae bacterium VKM Ac-2854]